MATLIRTNLYLFQMIFQMKLNFLLLLFLALAVMTQGQQGASLQNIPSDFDSAVPVPVNTFDVTQSPPNLRIQNQQVPAVPATANQSPPSISVPQQPAAQNTPAATTPLQSTQTPQAPQQASNEPPKILITQVNHPIVGRGFKQDNGVSYQRIKVGVLSQKYLFFNFNLAEKDKWQQVNITISVEGSQQILNLCHYTGIDDCYVPSFTLKPESVLFVHIQCQDDCSYNLNAQWSDTQHLRPGDEALFMFGKDTTQIYHVELDDQDFEEMRIHLAPRVTRRPFDNVKIYGKYGKDATPTPKDYDFKSINLWEDGEGIFIRKADLKQKKMVLLVVGQTETTYRLTLKLVRELQHEIENGEHIYEYLPAKSERSYHIKSIPNAFDQYSLRLSVLSGGDLDVGYFIDKELKNKLQFQPFEFMKDSEYVLNAELIDPSNEGLYIRIKAQEKDATYTIKFVGRKKADSIELNENVYGFIEIHNQSRFAHFDFKRWAEETDVQANMKFTVYIIEAKGKVSPEFLVCQSTLSLCTNPNFYKNTTVPIPFKSQGSLSQKQIFELQVQDKLLKKINVAEQQAIIVVKLNPQKPKKGQEDDFSLVAVQLLNNNKVLYLREGRPLQEKMNAQEVKVYKYINSDPNVEEIRIHINEITGVVNFGGFIQGEDTEKSVQVAAEGNTLRFTTNLTQPIYVSVGAKSKAIFGISMQVIHKSSTHKNVTVATISQDLTYKVRIQPNSYAIYEVVPIFYSFNFKYTSSQSVIVCAINPQTNSCLNPKDPMAVPNLDVKGSITDAKLFDRKARIKITNPFSDSVAEVSFIFHSRESGHCEDKAIGQVFQEVVKDGECISFIILDEKKTLDLYVSKREFASFNYRVLVCDNVLADASTLKNVEVTPEAASILCGGSKGNRRVSVIWSVTTKNIDKEQKTLRVNLLAQYRGDLVLLPQGVSYNKIATVQDKMVGKFAFNIVNKRMTRIVLSQIRGNFQMFAKITEQGRRETDPISNLNYRYTSSQAVGYSQEPTIIIPEADIKGETCRDCIILIAVYTEIPQGFEVQFDIEVAQKYSALNEDTAVQGYLDVGSFAYYSYESRQQGESTILFLLSDHNSQCANMYLSNFETNVGPAAHIAKSVGENELIFRHNGGEKRYYLAVEAVKTCDYSLSVLTIDSSIHNLKRGKQNLIKFPAGVVKYFSLEHSTNEPFKILSLAKYGQINIYINKSSINVDRKTFTTDQLALSKFTYKSPYKNSLTIDSTSPLFCQKCTYFVAIEALKNTEATLYLVYPQTSITLTEGHFLSDHLAKSLDFTIATYKRIEKTQFKLRVYSGSLKLYTFYKEKFTTTDFSASDHEQTFEVDYSVQSKEKSNAPVEGDPNLGKNPVSPSTGQQERIPLNIMVTAESDNVSYTLEVVSLGNGSSINQLAAYQSLIPGEPNPISISSDKPLCLTGYLRDPKETLILSANNDNRDFLSKLAMQATLGGEKADISKTFTRNILGITLTPTKSTVTPNTTAPTKTPATTGIRFELCFKLPEPEGSQSQVQDDSVTEVQADEEQSLFNASITQANTVNILPSDTDSEVKGDSIFVIHSDGEFLLDVFECKDVAKISVGNSLQNIEKSKLKMLDMVSMPDQRHAVRVSEKETTFVKIQSTHSIVRWIPIDYEADRGLGYLKYASGDLRYSSKFKEVVVEYQPLQQSKPTKSKVKDVKYSLYVSNVTESIDFSSQCSTQSSDVVKFDLPSPPLKKSTETAYLTYTIEKQELEKLFEHSENIYLSVVCDLSLSVTEGKAGWDEHEHYKFIYPRQQLPLETYQQNQIESIPYHYLVLLLAAVTAILILCTYLFTRKIVPLIARLKNSNLVEEEPPQEHKDDLEVPASSDRNQRAPDIAVETEEKFGK